MKSDEKQQQSTENEIENNFEKTLKRIHKVDYINLVIETRRTIRNGSKRKKSFV